MNSLVTDRILVGVVLAVIVMQLEGTTIGARRLLILPAVLVVLGAVNLNGTHGVNGTDISYSAASAASAAVIGIVQGCVMRLEQRNGALWGQVPLWGLWLWGALLVSRLAVHVVADASGATAATTTQRLPRWRTDGRGAAARTPDAAGDRRLLSWPLPTPLRHR